MKQPVIAIRKGSGPLTNLTRLVCLCLLPSAPALAGIGDAVDAPSLTWNADSLPGGLSNWFDQNVYTHDGTDAAESGDIDDSQLNWIETTVVGPGKLFFWWKVSCEEPDGNELYDYLSFSTNGVEAVASIAAEVDWTWHLLDIAGGAQVLRWSYNKDDSVSGGLDRGWVDEVAFFSGDVPPIIVTNVPSSITAPVGGTAQLTISAIGTAPLSHQWRRDGLNLVSAGHITGTTSSTLTLSPVQPTDLGTYTVVITNAAGSIASAPTVLYTLDQLVDTTNLAWTMSGDADWTGQTSVNHDGVDAARSGAITDDQQTSIGTSIIGTGLLSFWWKVSSEVGTQLGDTLQFFSNNVPLLSISGEVDWQLNQFVLGDGVHNFEWRYSKDSTLSFGQDRGWVDEVTFIREGVLPFTLSPSGFAGGVFQISLQGEPDRIYRLSSSSNLLDWMPIQTNSAPSGVVWFTDPSAPGQPRRYYRAETNPD